MKKAPILFCILMFAFVGHANAEKGDHFYLLNITTKLSRGGAAAPTSAGAPCYVLHDGV